jgi:hypothetical protein
MGRGTSSETVALHDRLINRRIRMKGIKAPSYKADLRRNGNLPEGESDE